MIKMSVLSKFFKWLKGEKPPPSPSEIRASLRILERRLIRYENELKLKRKKAIRRTREYLRNGELEIAKEHAKQAILYERNLKNTMKIRAQLENLKGLLERGLVMQQLAISIRKMIPILSSISRTTRDKELLRALTELAKVSERMGISEEVLIEGMDIVSESSEDLSVATEELLKKLASEEGIALPAKEEAEKISEEEVERFIRKILKEEGE